jgi:uncharacterized protein
MKMDLETLRREYKTQILEIAAKYNASDVRVFGSLVKGSNTEESDIDFLVKFNDKASLLDEAGLERELNDLIKTKIDLIADDSIRDEFSPYIINGAIKL